MKTKHLPALLVAASGLLCGPRYLMAQDTPPGPPPVEAPMPPPRPGNNADNNKPKAPDGDRREGEHGHRRHEGERGGPDHRGPEMKPTPFIGVMTRPLSPEVRAQTGLPEGFGLLVEEVLPESPAKTAGLLQHDVLVLLGDQRLVNTEQLAALVRSNAKDSDIVFTIKRAGAEQKVTVKVGEKMMPAIQFDGPGSRWPGFPGGGFDERRFGNDMRENMGRFQQGMREFQERMQDWSRGPRDKPAPQPPQYGRDPKQDYSRPDGDNHGPRGPQPKGPRPDGDKGPPPGRGDEGSQDQGPKDQGAAPRSSAQSSSSVQVDGSGNVVTSSLSTNNTNFERNVTRRDKTGEYSLRQEGSEKIFTAKPVDGQEQTFTVTTEEQRKAVPESFREKLQELEGVSRQVKSNGADETPAPVVSGGRTTTI